MKLKLTKEQLDYFKKEGSKGGKRRWANMTPEERKAAVAKMQAGRQSKIGGIDKPKDK